MIVSVSVMLLIPFGGCSGKNVKQEPSEVSAEADEDVWYKKTSEDSPLPRACTDVVVNISTTPTLKEDYPGMIQDCLDSAVNRLKSTGGFQQVRAGGPDGPFEDNTLLVKGYIPEMRIASTSARFWGGALAGASYINMDVQLVDGKTGEVLREKKLSSTANPLESAWTWGGTDRSIDDDMGRILADYVKAVMP